MIWGGWALHLNRPHHRQGANQALRILFNAFAMPDHSPRSCFALVCAAISSTESARSDSLFPHWIRCLVSRHRSGYGAPVGCQSLVRASGLLLRCSCWQAYLRPATHVLQQHRRCRGNRYLLRRGSIRVARSSANRSWAASPTRCGSLRFGECHRRHSSDDHWCLMLDRGSQHYAE